MREVGFTTDKVAVEIDGKLDYYTEAEIRALQVIARRKAMESDEAFKEFCNTVTVYKGRCKGQPRKAGYDIMKFKKDGRFEEPFFPGFSDVNKKLVFLLMSMP